MHRRFFTLLVAAALTALSPSMAHADQARIAELYQTALITKREGKLPEARQLFQEILRVQPNHRDARRQLALLKPGRSEAQSGKRVAAFRALRLKSIDFENTTVTEALQTLDYLAREASGKKLVPNFVVKDPEKKLANRRINLRLSNVPLATAVKYVAEQAGANVRYGPYVTAITPR